MPSDKRVSQGFKQFRSHLSRGGSRLVGIMEICEIVMESIGNQHQSIAGLRQVGGREPVQCGIAWCCGAESRWVPAHWQCRHWQWSRSSSGVPVTGRLPLPAPAAAVQHPSYLITLHRHGKEGEGGEQSRQLLSVGSVQCRHQL